MEIKISDELNSIIRYAREEAMRTGSYGIGPDHLFLGMMRHSDNDACRLLAGLGVDIDEFKRFIDSHITALRHKRENSSNYPFPDKEKTQSLFTERRVL